MEYLERTLSYLTTSLKNHDSKLFTRSSTFTSTPPTLTITSPDCGPSGSLLDKDHAQDGANLFPSLTWSLPSSLPSNTISSYLLVVEDPDAPLPNPIVHGGYYDIPADRTAISHGDLVKTGEGNELKGGFRFVKNRRGTVYSGPRPLRGHGEHRYFYQVVALKGGLVGKKMSAVPTKEELMQQVEGKVLGWGEWVGVAIRP